MFTGKLKKIQLNQLILNNTVMLIRLLKLSFFTLLILLTPHHTKAQSFTISGFITDKATGEVLVGAYVFCPQTSQGTITNNCGYYAISIPFGAKNIMFMNEGYFARIDTTLIHMNQQVDVELRKMEEDDLQTDPFSNTKIEVEEIDEADTLADGSQRVRIKNPNVINALIEFVLKRNAKINDRIQNGYIEVPGTQISKMPSLGGEIDVVRSIKHLPGVMPGTELTPGLYVRGGGQDQNLVLLDGVPVYNMNHAFGLYSIFNSESINSINLTKSGFSSNQGGRLSAITDITMKEGNKSGIHGIFLNSLIAFTLNLDGPLSRDGRTTFSLASRRSHWDLFFFRPFSTSKNKFTYAFYDVNLKVAHRINNKNKLIFSILSNRDRFYIYGKGTDTINNGLVQNEDGFDIRWGNFTGSVKLNRVINERLFSTITAYYSQYKSQMGLMFASQYDSANVTNKSRLDFKYFNFIRDYTARLDYEYLINKSSTLKFGGSLSYKQIMPGTTSFKFNQNGVLANDTFYGLSKSLRTSELAVYVEDEIKINPDFKLSIGGRFVNYAHKGNMFNFIEPRISFNKRVDNRFSFKGSYTVMNQNLHFLGDNINSNIFSLNFDRWVPATALARPERAQQITLGLSKPFENDYEISIEAYYKRLSRLLEIKEGVDINTGLLTSTEWESKVVEGKGWNYGFEAFLQKRRGRTTGWLSYTLAWAKRNTPGVNLGQDYYYQFDRRHYINLVAQTKIDDVYSLSWNVVFSTGNVQSLPVGKYLDINGNVVYDYTAKNNYRLRNTVRFDIGLTKARFKSWAAESGYRFSVYNVLARNNPAYVYIDNSGKTPTAYQRAFLLFIPGVTYYIKF